MKRAWSDIGNHIELEGATSVDQCLGVKHVFFEYKSLVPGTTVRGIEFNMVDYMRSCVDAYQNVVQSICGQAAKLKSVDTPFHPLLVGDASGVVGNAPQTAAPQWGEKIGDLAPKAYAILMIFLWRAFCAMGLAQNCPTTWFESHKMDRDMRYCAAQACLLYQLYGRVSA